MPATTAEFDTLADLLHSLGDIPLHRILWKPPPGTATEADAIRLNEREKRRVELIDGTLVEKAMGFPESFLAAWIVACITNYAAPRKLGLVGGADLMIRVIGTQVRLPDAGYFPWPSIPNTEELRRPVGRIAPALVVEVMSPSNTRREIERKRREFFAAGTKLFWVVDPKTETIEVYKRPTKTVTLTTDDTLDGGAVLPGFALKVADLFAYLDPPTE